jgi:uncharacterized heparinase superfamily protein
MFHRIGLYWRTIRYLSLAQIVRKFCFNFLLQVRFFYVFNPRVDLRRPPGREFKYIRTINSIDLQRMEASYIGKTFDFDFKNWNPSRAPKLWKYNLHYFNHLRSRCANVNHTQSDLLDEWVISNKPFRGIGWDPYPTSLRSINIIKYYFAGNALEQQIVKSLALQIESIYQSMEYHLGFNHLFTNAKALFFGACCFEGEASIRWMNKGIEIINKLSEDMLTSDGGHVERSPMYQSLYCEDLLDLINLQQFWGFETLEPTTTRLRQQVIRALIWNGVFRFSSDRLPYFNDTTSGEAPTHSELMEYARAILHSSEIESILKKIDGVNSVFGDSGFSMLSTPLAKMIVDTGSVLARRNPGHHHAGCLAFELEVNGEMILVNKGVSCYAGPSRVHERGTQSYNTVSVGDENSSEIWSNFRVGRAADSKILSYTVSADEFFVSACHDGFLNSNNIMHHRAFQLSKGRLIVLDELTSRNENAVARFRFAPGNSVQLINGSLICLTPKGQSVTINFSSDNIQLKDCYHASQFGKKNPSTLCEVKISSFSLASTIQWTE